MLKLEGNCVYPQELYLLWDASRKEWKRILFFNERGQAVEVLCTPMNPAKRDSWDEVSRMLIRMHSTYAVYGNGINRCGDRLCRHLVRNRHSIVFNMVRQEMLRHLSFECVNRLLYWDFLPSIDWDAYLVNHNGGGCAYALCKTTPRG